MIDFQNGGVFKLRKVEDANSMLSWLHFLLRERRYLAVIRMSGITLFLPISE